MEIIFASKKIKKQMNEQKAMIRVHGPRRARKLQVVLTSLAAAQHLGIFGPPYSPPHRCHELTGDRKGQLSVDLDHPYRLLFEPANDPIPVLKEGGLDWNSVTIIRIIGVEDTHD